MPYYVYIIRSINYPQTLYGGGFENGLFMEAVEMDESNPKVLHFRASPDKYPEIIDKIP